MSARLRALAFGVALPCALFAFVEGVLALFADPRPSPLLRVETADGVWLTREPGLLERGGVPEEHSDRILFAPDKAAGTFRVFVVGESTAAGFPLYPFLSFGRVFEQRIREHAACEVEVINLGKAADPSSRVRDVALAALDHDADLLVVYSGHNDFQWPYGEELRERGPSRLVSWVQSTRLARWFRGAPEQRDASADARAGSKAPQPPDGRLVGDDPHVDVEVLKRGAERFAGHIEEIVDAAGAREVPVLLLEQVSNLYSFAPNYSCFPEDFRSDRAAFEQELRVLRDGLASPEPPADALARSARLADLGVALACWVHGRWLEREGDLDAARLLLAHARDIDGYPSRAPLVFNGILANTASTEAHVRFVELAPVFDAASSRASPGDDLFLDHCHPTIDATFLLGDALFDASQPLLRELGVLENEAPASAGIDRSAADRRLGEMGLSRAFLATRAAAAGVSALLSYVQSPSSLDPLRLALWSFEEALKVDPSHVRSWTGRCAAHVLLGDRESALFCADKARVLAPSEQESLTVLSSFPVFDQALHNMGLELRDGLPHAAENDP